MKVSLVRCRNFRNIENCQIELDDNITVLIGKNGQGKTNFLESIYYCSTTRSFRIQHDQECIQHDKELARVECRVQDEDTIRNCALVIHEKGKTCFLSNQPISKTSEFAGKLNAVLFSPSDLEIFNDSPRVRRKLMDVEISKADSRYSMELNRYNRLMKERNSVLKQEKLNDDLLDSLDQQMAAVSLIVIKKRKEFVNQINERLSTRYEQLADEKKELFCNYINYLDGTEEIDEKMIGDKLRNNRQRDFILKATSTGIHRDDLEFIMDGHSIINIASQGQRRMTVLSLKMAFVDYAIAKTGKKPILLLDDVLSELDQEKRRNLFKTIPQDIQTVITTTDLDELKDDWPIKPKILRVENGNIREDEEVWMNLQK